MSETSKTPTHMVFAVLDPPGNTRGDEDGPRSKWLKLGAGWRNQDGSISCLLDVFPLAWMAGFRGQFKLVLQEPRQDDERRDSRSGRGNRR